MATYYSKQSWVSDGTLELVTPSIKYLEKAHLEVQSDVAWAWDGDSIRFVSPIPDGDEVMLVRHTPFNNLMHIFSVVQGGGGSAAWTNLSVDENYTQLMYLLQEIAEGTFEYDPGMGPGDSYTKDEVDTMLAHCLRAAASDPVLREIPGIAERRNLLLGFDNDGQPVVYPQGSSAPDLEDSPPADGYIQVDLDQRIQPTLLHRFDQTLYSSDLSGIAAGLDHFSRVGDVYVGLVDGYTPEFVRFTDLYMWDLEFNQLLHLPDTDEDYQYSDDLSSALGDLFIVGYGGGADPGPYEYGLRYFNTVTQEWGFAAIPERTGRDISTVVHSGYLYVFTAVGSTVQMLRGSVVSGALVLEPLGPTHTAPTLAHSAMEIYMADPSGAGTLGIQARANNTDVLLFDLATNTWSTHTVDIETPAGYTRDRVTYTRYSAGVGSPTVSSLSSFDFVSGDSLLTFETESPHGEAVGTLGFTQGVALTRPWGPVNLVVGSDASPGGLHVLTPQGAYEVNVGVFGGSIAHVSVADGVVYGVSQTYTLTNLPAPYPMARVSAYVWRIDIDLDSPGVAWLRVGGGTELPDGPGPYWVENKGWVVPGADAVEGEVLRRTAGGVAFSALGTAADRNVPTAGDAQPAQVVLGSDSRLADARPPTAHTHTLAQITGAGTAASRNVPASGDAGPSEVVLGSDSRLVGAVVPTLGVGVYFQSVEDGGTVARVLTPRAFAIDGNTAVYASALVAPVGGTALFEVYVESTRVGDIEFTGTTGTWTVLSNVTADPGDALTILCVDAYGIENVSITLGGI